MDIRHVMGGDMTIGLDGHDVEFMEDNGYCMDRNGVSGHETKTWVRKDFPATKAYAQIDGASDVMVYLPYNAELPVRVENADIDPFTDSDRGRVEHFFGTAGAIVVRAVL